MKYRIYRNVTISLLLYMIFWSGASLSQDYYPKFVGMESSYIFGVMIGSFLILLSPLLIWKIWKRNYHEAMYILILSSGAAANGVLFGNENVNYWIGHILESQTGYMLRQQAASFAAILIAFSLVDLIMITYAELELKEKKKKIDEQSAFVQLEQEVSNQ